MAPVDGKMKQSSFRWFGHVQRREVTKPMRSDLIQVKGTKEEEDLKSNW